MALIRKLYVPRNLTLPEVEKAFRSVQRSFSISVKQAGYKNFRNLTVNTTLDNTYDIVLCKDNAFTVTLPPSADYFDSNSDVGISFTVINDIDNANNITVAADGSELILDSNTLTVPPGSSPTIVTDGTKWYAY